MNNHYHLLVETVEGNLSIGMRQVNGVYTQYFNRRYSRPGHIFQGRFKAILVEKNSHLMEICRYIVLNPVRAGIIHDPLEWKWSSYSLMLKESEKMPSLCNTWILEQFSENKMVAKKLYKKFVLEGISKKSPWTNVKNRIVYGSDTLAQKVNSVIKRKRINSEISREERFAGRPALANIFKGKDIVSGLQEACFRYGYKQIEISNFLNLHYSTISKKIKVLTREENNNSSFKT